MMAQASEKDRVLICELWDGYASALTAGDMERWFSLWIRRGIEITADGLVCSGTEQIRAALQPVLDLFDMQLAVFPKNVRILGDCAHSFGSYRRALTPKEGGELIRDSGLFLSVLEKQTDGSWRIAMACFKNSAALDGV